MQSSLKNEPLSIQHIAEFLINQIDAELSVPPSSTGLCSTYSSNLACSVFSQSPVSQLLLTLMKTTIQITHRSQVFQAYMVRINPAPSA